MAAEYATRPRSQRIGATDATLSPPPHARRQSVRLHVDSRLRSSSSSLSGARRVSLVVPAMPAPRIHPADEDVHDPAQLPPAQPLASTEFLSRPRRFTHLAVRDANPLPRSSVLPPSDGRLEAPSSELSTAASSASLSTIPICSDSNGAPTSTFVETHPPLSAGSLTAVASSTESSPAVSCSSSDLSITPATVSRASADVNGPPAPAGSAGPAIARSVDDFKPRPLVAPGARTLKRITDEWGQLDDDDDDDEEELTLRPPPLAISPGSSLGAVEDEDDDPFKDIPDWSDSDDDKAAESIESIESIDSIDSDGEDKSEDPELCELEAKFRVEVAVATPKKKVTLPEESPERSAGDGADSPGSSEGGSPSKDEPTDTAKPRQSGRTRAFLNRMRRKDQQRRMNDKYKLPAVDEDKTMLPPAGRTARMHRKAQLSQTLSPGRTSPAAPMHAYSRSETDLSRFQDEQDDGAFEDLGDIDDSSVIAKMALSGDYTHLQSKLRDVNLVKQEILRHGTMLRSERMLTRKLNEIIVAKDMQARRAFERNEMDGDSFKQLIAGLHEAQKLLEDQAGPLDSVQWTRRGSVFVSRSPT